MRRFRYDFSAELSFSQAVQEQYTVLRCLPYPDEVQRMLSGSVTVEPWHPFSYGMDGFGNRTMSGSFRTPHDRFYYREQAEVLIDLSKRREETAHPMYRHPGLLSRPDESIRDFALSLPTQEPETLAAAVSDHFRYVPGATGVATTISESFAKGEGVCQDYAQTLAAVCRLKGLPARYCMGITEGTGVTHAWTEVHWRGRWLGIDPTRRCLADEGYLRFAVGRDAQDCPVERGSFVGIARQKQQVFASMQEE